MKAVIQTNNRSLFNSLVQFLKSINVLVKTETEKTGHKKRSDSSDLKKFLLQAPTFTDAQVEQIAQTRKHINQWRTKPF